MRARRFVITIALSVGSAIGGASPASELGAVSLSDASSAAAAGFDVRPPLQSRTVTTAGPPLSAKQAVVRGRLGVVSVGDLSACAVLQTGAVQCWGSNAYGQFAPSGTGAPAVYGPTTVPGLAKVSAVVVGRLASCAIVGAGTVSCWGSGGVLGDGTRRGSSVPVKVLADTGQPLRGVKVLSIGAAHACAIAGRGEIRCWGANGSGQLGDGSTRDRVRAARVPIGQAFADVTAGDGHTCALGERGDVWCWGANDRDQLGQRRRAMPERPMQVLGLPKAIAVRAGATHTCAVQADRSVRCWGDMDGLARYRPVSRCDGASSDACGTPSPRDPGLRNVLSLSAGKQFNCALAADRTASCWGSNAFRAIDDGDAAARAPQKTAVKDLIALDVGAGTTCAVTSLGAVLCWGANFGGEAGDRHGLPRSPKEPVRVPLAGAAAVQAFARSK